MNAHSSFWLRRKSYALLPVRAMGYPRKRAQSAGANAGKRFKPPTRGGGFAGRNMRSMVRKEILRTTETKMHTQYANTVNLNHNSWYYNGNALSIVQGDGKNQMVGEEVFLRNMVVKLHFNTKPDRSQVMLRVMLVKIPADKDSTSMNLLFEGSTNGMIAMPNVTECIILTEKTVRMSGTSQYAVPSGAGTVFKDLAETCTLRYNFKDTKTKYDAGKPKYYNIRLAVVAYDAHSTLTGDTIAEMQFTSRVFFKDP